jgi:hypothetical protein
MKHLINANDIVESVDSGSSIPPFELNGQYGLITQPPAEFKNILHDKYVMRLQLTSHYQNNLVEFCMMKYNLMPYVIRRSYNSDTFEFLSTYDPDVNYCIVLIYNEPEEFYIVLSDSVNTSTVTVLNDELPNLLTLIQKFNNVDVDNDAVYNHISWLSRLVDKSDYPRLPKDINNRVIYVVREKNVIGFLYKYTYFSIPVMPIAYTMTNLVDNVKVKAEILMTDEYGEQTMDKIYEHLYRKIFNTNNKDEMVDIEQISDKIYTYIHENYVMNKYCAMVHNKYVYDMPYRIRYPKLSLFNPLYITKVYVEYHDRSELESAGDGGAGDGGAGDRSVGDKGVGDGAGDKESSSKPITISAIVYNGVVQFVDDDLKSSSPNRPHPYLHKYKNTSVAYLDKNMKILHLENAFKFKRLNQNLGIKRNILIKTLLNHVLSIYFKLIINEAITNNAVRNNFMLTFADVEILFKLLKLFAPVTSFSTHGDSKIVNTYKSKISYDELKKYWQENHSGGINFSELNALLYYHNKDDTIVFDKNTVIDIKDFMSMDTE